jgi:hypothetical protein
MPLHENQSGIYVFEMLSYAPLPTSNKIWWNSALRAKLENQEAPHNSSNNSSITGIGYLNFTVSAFMSL